MHHQLMAPMKTYEGRVDRKPKPEPPLLGPSLCLYLCVSSQSRLKIFLDEQEKLTQDIPFFLSFYFSFLQKIEKQIVYVKRKEDSQRARACLRERLGKKRREEKGKVQFKGPLPVIIRADFVSVNSRTTTGRKSPGSWAESASLYPKGRTPLRRLLSALERSSCPRGR